MIKSYLSEEENLEVALYPIAIPDQSTHTLLHFRPKWSRSRNLYLISDQNGLQTIPFGGAHTSMSYIREYSPTLPHAHTHTHRVQSSLHTGNIYTHAERSLSWLLFTASTKGCLDTSNEWWNTNLYRYHGVDFLCPFMKTTRLPTCLMKSVG